MYTRIITAILSFALISGCSYTTTMAETESPDGRPIKAPPDAVVAMEAAWSRENQLVTIEKITEKLLARPDSDGNVSAEGEAGHNWKQAMVARDLAVIIGDDSYNYFQLKAQVSTNRHRTAQQAMYMLAPRVLDRILYGDGGAVAQNGGTYIKQNNTVEGSRLSNDGPLTAGAGGPGGEAPGGAGGPATGGSRGNSIGGIGNMQNAQDAYNGFQNRFDRILHGTGTIGKQPQAALGDGNAFAPIADDDKVSVGF